MIVPVGKVRYPKQPAMAPYARSKAGLDVCPAAVADSIRKLMSEKTDLECKIREMEDQLCDDDDMYASQLQKFIDQGCGPRTEALLRKMKGKKIAEQLEALNRIREQLYSTWGTSY
jgi:hypothetical protein